MAAARRAKHNEQYVHGSAARVLNPEPEQPDELADDSVLRNQVDHSHRERLKKNSSAHQSAPSISLFAIIGFFAVASLMIFVMLAQVNLNEITRETARLTSQLEILEEQRRVLSITFESVINMDEVERYARDVLGMSTPEAGQYTVIRTFRPDRVEVFDAIENEDRFREIGNFLTFLFDEYIR